MPGKGKKMKDKHRENIRAAVKVRHRAFDLAVEHYLALKLQDRMTAEKTYKEWRDLGRKRYESKRPL